MSLSSMKRLEASVIIVAILATKLGTVAHKLRTPLKVRFLMKDGVIGSAYSKETCPVNLIKSLAGLLVKSQQESPDCDEEVVSSKNKSLNTGFLLENHTALPSSNSEPRAILADKALPHSHFVFSSSEALLSNLQRSPT
ncbi:hypothetical protein PIB30_036300 [Stylosanthes scabra]|uniref:Uncharacterized protein n=1 Tax=Stylosanthes scabra TaxID=79078 RepID=A0ABU6RDH4_9FABA|nr:hypothetical protein [Stylosanthes scabra]